MGSVNDIHYRPWPENSISQEILVSYDSPAKLCAWKTPPCDSRHGPCFRRDTLDNASDLRSERCQSVEMDVSLNGGAPKSSIFIHFNRDFHYNHPFWGTTIFGNTQMISSSMTINFARKWHNQKLVYPNAPCMEVGKDGCPEICVTKT